MPRTGLHSVLDYYKYAAGWNKRSGFKTKLYYLTIDGNPPSKESISLTDGSNRTVSLTDSDYKTISWREDIVSWLRMIIKEMDSGKEKPLQSSIWR